jgi:hypothetical protein
MISIKSTSRRGKKGNKQKRQNQLMLEEGYSQHVASSVRPMLNPTLAEPIVVKRMTFATTATAAAGTGVINPAQVNSGQGATLPSSEWASYQSRFLLFRCRELRYTAFPVSCNTSVFPTANVGSWFAMCDWAIVAPSTAGQILSEESVTLHPTVGFEPLVRVVTWKKNPNAKLWTDTNAAAIVADRQFGLGLCSAPNVVITQPATATLVFAVVLEWVYEFKNMR